MILKKISFILFITFFTFSLNSMEIKKIGKDNKINFYTGMFDFSDHGQKSTLVGIQHQDENLNRNTFLGNISPVTGAFMTTKGLAGYIYTGVQANYKFRNLSVTPSFTPGLYTNGKSKNLGHPIEFKTEVQISFDLLKNSELGFSYNHMSNAQIGDHNPGSNSYMFNYIKNF